MIHVMFSTSAAGTLRQLLRERGVRQEVVDLYTWLDFGPIASGETQERTEWFNRCVPDPFDDWTWFDEESHRFRRIESDKRRLIWIAPQSAEEQCGLLRFVSHFGSSGTQMIIADHGLRHGWQGEAPRSLGQLGVQPMGELYDESPRIDWDSARFRVDRWPTLMAEGALLRVVINGHLQSVSDDFFDHFLLAACPSSWTKHYRVIGDAMGGFIWEAGHDINDLFLLWRLRELIALGRIVSEGNRLPRALGSEEVTRIRRA